MALSLAVIGTRKGGKRLYRWVETGAANTALAATLVSDTNAYRLLGVTCSYSAAPTQAGVTTDLDSGAGAAYDTNLNTGAANARYTNYLPAGDILLGTNDGLVVTAPAGGAGITAAVAIYLEDA